MEYITSLSNNKIKKIVKLKEAKVRKVEKKFLIEGKHLIEDAFKKGLVLTLLGSEEQLQTLSHLNTQNIEILVITNPIAEKLSDVVTSQNLFAVCQFLEQTIDLEHNILILDQLQNPGNLGTLIRSAAAFNFKTIIASENTVNFYNDKVLRSTQGNFFQVNLINQNLITTMEILKNNNYQIIGTTLHQDAQMLNDVNWSRKSKYALIIGNEANGISSQISQLIDFNVLVEMDVQVESLNAGVAGSLIMYNIQNC
ncbi:RNA methyltransferase, TrmH family [Williamsoniiplasma somnilux]|uniref:RNA methyltransferase, TrmH family n=1 Tax=Williamsoniiplasma somnilux TaxID=215578 RepID=A0A2K8NXT1_9MOLU|nr:RNA methyltransferase [Williamsoniiplasma somnilux]ATZ18645.1 RNA methyltransferase, TrmH family [Williamsoniiplasma somnilux]